jgi:hypothetical protein
MNQRISVSAERTPFGCFSASVQKIDVSASFALDLEAFLSNRISMREAGDLNLKIGS